MKAAEFQEFMKEYATHFDLLKDIVFSSNVLKVTRNQDDTKWVLQVQRGEQIYSTEVDKVAFCHGYQTKANVPVFPGQDNYQGIIMHSQQYRRLASGATIFTPNNSFSTNSTTVRNNSKIRM